MSTWVLEHKTTSQPIGAGENFWARLQLGQQPSIYVDAAIRLGYQVEGVLYDVLRKPDVRVRKDETPEAYGARTLEAIVADPDMYFRRGKVVRLSTERARALIDIKATTRAIREQRRDVRWPRNPDACERFGRWCEYFDVCTGTASLDDPVRFETRDPAGKVLSVSASSLSQLARCQHEFYLSKVLGKRARFKGEALRIGTELHSALESWLHDLDVDKAIAAMGGCKNEHERAKLAAIVLAYDARWRGEDLRVIAVEKSFDLSIPGVRGFRLTGRFDGIVEELSHATTSANAA